MCRERYAYMAPLRDLRVCTLARLAFTPKDGGTHRLAALARVQEDDSSFMASSVVWPNANILQHAPCTVLHASREHPAA